MNLWISSSYGCVAQFLNAEGRWAVGSNTSNIPLETLLIIWFAWTPDRSTGQDRQQHKLHG